MRKNFGAKPMCYPMPVYIIATYGADGTPNAFIKLSSTCHCEERSDVAPKRSAEVPLGCNPRSEGKSYRKQRLFCS